MRQAAWLFSLGFAVALGGSFYGCGGDSGGGTPDGGVAAAGSGGSGTTGGRGGSGLPGSGGNPAGTGGAVAGGGGNAPPAGGNTAGSPGAGGQGGKSDGGVDGPFQVMDCPNEAQGRMCSAGTFCADQQCQGGERVVCQCGMNGRLACTEIPCQSTNPDGGFRRDANDPFALSMCPSGAMDEGQCTRQQGQNLNACELGACANNRHMVCFCGNDNRYNCISTSFGCQ